MRARCPKTKTCDHDNQRTFKPRKQKLYIGGSSGPDNVEACNQPGHRDGKDLPPAQMQKGWLREKTEYCKGTQHPRQSCGDGSKRRRFCDSDLRPHVEKAGK